MKIPLMLSILAYLAFLPSLALCAGQFGSFAICYSDRPDIERLSKFDAVIVDPGAKVDPKKLVKKGVAVFAYLSIGEISSSSPDFSEVSESGVLLAENRNWKGSHIVDTSSDEWRNYVLEEAIPNIIKKGYSGLFLDTLDSPGSLEGKGPAYRGLGASVLSLVLEIRKKYPKLKLAANNFEEQARKIPGAIDILVAEDIFTSYDFRKKRYSIRAPADYAGRVRRLLDASSELGVQVLVVEYTAPGRRKDMARVYETARSAGFIPYIAAIGLEKIDPYMIELCEEYSDEL